MTLPTLSEIEAAHALVLARMPPTPQYAWPLLSARVGAEVWVKHENHTPTGAFKVRGGIVHLDRLAKAGCRRILTATRGNHGQSIPYAAAPHGIPVQVWVPQGNSPEKNAAMRAWGADLVVHGADFEEARVACAEAAAAEGATLIPPYHPDLVAGVATYALELFRAAPPLDAVYVPVGMGSGACGVIAARDALGLKTEVVFTVSAHADAYARSFEAGKVVATDTSVTFADGMSCRVPWEEPLAALLKGAARVVRVTDDQVADAMRALWADTHNAAEGAGAAATAALLAEADRMRGKRVGVILCGGNVDAGWFAQVLSGGTPRP